MGCDYTLTFTNKAFDTFAFGANTLNCYSKEEHWAVLLLMLNNKHSA
jgi:hypothetical protein